ncbi:MAG: type II toxin-antitoxin system RelE/ParE family toxin [Acidobacteriota bacterium]
MSSYVLSNEALRELDGIWEYIARDDIEAANRWIAKLLDACEMLAQNPGVGHVRKEVADRSIQFWAVGKYLIVYRLFDEHIEIVAFTQGARDIPSFLRRHS